MLLAGKVHLNGNSLFRGVGAYRVKLDILPFHADIQQAYQENHAAIISGRQ